MIASDNKENSMAANGELQENDETKKFEGYLHRYSRYAGWRASGMVKQTATSQARGEAGSSSSSSGAHSNYSEVGGGMGVCGYDSVPTTADSSMWVLGGEGSFRCSGVLDSCMTMLSCITETVQLLAEIKVTLDAVNEAVGMMGSDTIGLSAGRESNQNEVSNTGHETDRSAKNNGSLNGLQRAVAQMSSSVNRQEQKLTALLLSPLAHSTCGLVCARLQSGGRGELSPIGTASAVRFIADLTAFAAALPDIPQSSSNNRSSSNSGTKGLVGPNALLEFTRKHGLVGVLALSVLPKHLEKCVSWENMQEHASILFPVESVHSVAARTVINTFKDERSSSSSSSSGSSSTGLANSPKNPTDSLNRNGDGFAVAGETTREAKGDQLVGLDFIGEAPRHPADFGRLVTAPGGRYSLIDDICIHAAYPMRTLLGAITASGLAPNSRAVHRWIQH